MQGRRQDITSFSPLRELYGSKEGVLLFPIDICIYVDQGGKELLSYPSTSGQLLGQSVTNSGGGTFGTMLRYDWPPANPFQVYPFAAIKPSFDISSIATGKAPAPQVHIGDSIELQQFDDDFKAVRTGVKGTITGLIASRFYPDIAHRVMAYQIKIDQQLLNSSHGSRVITGTAGELLGMLLATQNQSNGTCEAMVFPASLV